jgi:hypothetical protein
VLAPRTIICPAFRAIGIPPDPKGAHNSHTCTVEIMFHRDLRGVLLIEEFSCLNGHAQHLD